MGSLFNELKGIEKEIDDICYTINQISYFMGCDLVSMTLSDLEPLKEILVQRKITASDDNVSLTKIDNPTEDIRAICNEWHFDDAIASRLISIAEDADGYYHMWADGSYASYGNLMSICRVLQKDDEFILLEFYNCD